MSDPLVERYETWRVPRYTSYPTAPHFTTSVGEGDYSAWLAAIPPETEASVYLHVPFCAQLCWYCGCNTSVTARAEPVQRYIETLADEIGLVAGLLPGQLPLRHLHWGGGTPTIAGAEGIDHAMAAIRRYFTLAKDAELAIEIDPRRLPPDTIDALSRQGFTRASLGVQTFDETVQRRINRAQTYEETAGAVSRLRAAGFEAINFDLIYGLPDQTLASCEDTVERALMLRPERLAVFGYAHVPTMKRHQALIPETSLPNAALRFEQAEAIAARLLEAGYVAIGLDHYALPGDTLVRALEDHTLRRNFQGYTTDDAPVLLGLGASAIGSLPGGYVQNVVPTGYYERMVAAGQLPVARGVAVRAEDRFRRALIEEILCYLEVDLGQIVTRFGRSLDELSEERERLADLADEGVVSLDGTRVRVAKRYRPMSRIVASVFDRYLQPDAMRHSVAV